MFYLWGPTREEARGGGCQRTGSGRRRPPHPLRHACRHGQSGRWRVLQPATAGRPSASSASPARARPCCPARSWASTSPPNAMAIGFGPVQRRRARRQAQSEMRELWGAEMAMVFQDPMTSLNPVVKVGRQLTEHLRYHLDISQEGGQADARSNCCAVCESPSPRSASTSTLIEMSGGMRQRVCIAIALACGPKMLFADEPTTALDVTVQHQILNLLRKQQRDRFMTMILVTHDLGRRGRAGRRDRGHVRRQARREGSDRRTYSPTCGIRTPRRLLRSIPKATNPKHTRLAGHRRASARSDQPAARVASSRLAAPTPSPAASKKSRRSCRPPLRTTPLPATSLLARQKTTPPIERNLDAGNPDPGGRRASSGNRRTRGKPVMHDVNQSHLIEEAR